MTDLQPPDARVLIPKAEVETYPFTGFVCLFGIMLHLFVSEPIMYVIGFDYAGDNNSFIEKQHPGTYLILLSFLMLLCRRGNPVGMLGSLFRSERIFTAFFGIYMLILTYMLLRSGAKGISFLIDTQICTAVAALVLTRTPASLCRAAIYIFIAFAVMNSMIGIGEGIAKVRLFAFDPTSSVMMDKTFRASAWLGHPLNNAMFTGVMIFVVLGIRIRTFLKISVCTILCVSLVAFGGRSGLLVSCLGLLFLGFLWAVRSWSKSRLSLFQILLLITAIIIIPLGFAVGMYGLINSNMGERLNTEGNFKDSSAQARMLAWQVFDYITPEEMVFGMAPSRTTEIRDRMSQTMELFLIENPWLLMFMHLGALAFPVWFVAMMAFMGRLMYRSPLPIKISAVAYFIIASTNNSFAVKGSLHLLCLCAILCAIRSLETKEEQQIPDQTTFNPNLHFALQ